MSQSYSKTCMYCKEKIEMSDKASGNWYPYNMDGTPHDCRNQTKTSTGTKKVETRPLSLEELDTRLKRVEAMFNGGPQK
jgi:hypothetical protein